MILAAALLSAMPVCPEQGKRWHCVSDGDTVWVEGEKVRLLNIDTPETEQAKCASERARGLAAKERLRALLAGGFTLERSGKLDRYGRTLATVRVNGRDVGADLVAENLARPWAGRRLPWC